MFFKDQEAASGHFVRDVSPFEGNARGGIINQDLRAIFSKKERFKCTDPRLEQRTGDVFIKYEGELMIT
jgi:hypothetical protein